MMQAWEKSESFQILSSKKLALKWNLPCPCGSKISDYHPIRTKIKSIS